MVTGAPRHLAAARCPSAKRGYWSSVRSPGRSDSSYSGPAHGGHRRLPRLCPVLRRGARRFTRSLQIVVGQTVSI